MGFLSKGVVKMSDNKPANPTGQGNQAPRGAEGGQPGMGGQEARTGQGSQGGMNSQNTWPNDPNGKGKYGTPSGQEHEDEDKDAHEDKQEESS
jgi:hypothetical protein